LSVFLPYKSIAEPAFIRTIVLLKMSE